jgi:hypothetical protein
VCKGNVGKPPGKFIWKKLRHGEQSPIIYSDDNTTSTEIPGKKVKRYQMSNQKP